MVRLPLAAIEKRIVKLEKRARLAYVPPLRIVDTMRWSDADRLAYADATDAEGDALIEKYDGPQPSYPAFLRVTAIVICASLAEPDDDTDDATEAPIDRDATARAHAERLRQIDEMNATAQAAEHAAEWKRLTRRD